MVWTVDFTATLWSHSFALGQVWGLDAPMILGLISQPALSLEHETCADSTLCFAGSSLLWASEVGWLVLRQTEKGLPYALKSYYRSLGIFGIVYNIAF